jgi:hypothetical protein
MADLDREIEQIEGGDAWDDADEVVGVEIRKTLDKVVPIRLPSDTW